MARRGDWNKQPAKDRDGKHRKELKKERRARLKNQQEARQVRFRQHRDAHWYLQAHISADPEIVTHLGHSPLPSLQLCFRILPSAAAIGVMMSFLFFLYLQDLHRLNQDGWNQGRPKAEASTIMSSFSNWKWVSQLWDRRPPLPEDDDDWEFCSLDDPDCEEEEEEDDDDDYFDDDYFDNDEEQQEEETTCCQCSSCPQEEQTPTDEEQPIPQFLQEDVQSFRNSDNQIENSSREERSRKDRRRRTEMNRRKTPRQVQKPQSFLATRGTTAEDTSFETRTVSADSSGGTEFIVHVERTSAAASDHVDRHFVEL